MKIKVLGIILMVLCSCVYAIEYNITFFDFTKTSFLVCCDLEGECKYVSNGNITSINDNYSCFESQESTFFSFQDFVYANMPLLLGIIVGVLVIILILRKLLR